MHIVCICIESTSKSFVPSVTVSSLLYLHSSKVKSAIIGRRNFSTSVSSQFFQIQ